MKRRNFLFGTIATGLAPIFASRKADSKQPNLDLPQTIPADKKKWEKGPVDFVWNDVSNTWLPKTIPALKAERTLHHIDICHFAGAVTPCGVVVEATKMDDSGGRHRVVEPGIHNKHPVGVLLNDVVDIDLRYEHLNWYADQVAVGSKVQILKIGIITSKVYGSSLAPGDPIYYTHNGCLTTEHISRTSVGTALSAKDKDGFAQVQIKVGHSGGGV